MTPTARIPSTPISATAVAGSRDRTPERSSITDAILLEHGGPVQSLPITKGEKAMRTRPWLPLALGLALAVTGPARADVWDVQTQNDNTVATENELVHGSDQLHDLGALPGPMADEDWFRLRQRSFSSY